MNNGTLQIEIKRVRKALKPEVVKIAYEESIQMLVSKLQVRLIFQNTQKFTNFLAKVQDRTEIYQI